MKSTCIFHVLSLSCSFKAARIKAVQPEPQHGYVSTCVPSLHAKHKEQKELVLSQPTIHSFATSTATSIRLSPVTECRVEAHTIPPVLPYFLTDKSQSLPSRPPSHSQGYNSNLRFGRIIESVKTMLHSKEINFVRYLM